MIKKCYACGQKLQNRRDSNKGWITNNKNLERAKCGWVDSLVTSSEVCYMCYRYLK